VRFGTEPAASIACLYDGRWRVSSPVAIPKNQYITRSHALACTAFQPERGCSNSETMRYASSPQAPRTPSTNRAAWGVEKQSRKKFANDQVVVVRRQFGLQRVGLDECNSRRVRHTRRSKPFPGDSNHASTGFDGVDRRGPVVHRKGCQKAAIAIAQQKGPSRVTSSREKLKTMPFRSAGRKQDARSSARDGQSGRSSPVKSY
jgi:hypothetical protein